jgi:hypothetical protein
VSEIGVLCRKGDRRPGLVLMLAAHVPHNAKCVAMSLDCFVVECLTRVICLLHVFLNLLRAAMTPSLRSSSIFRFLEPS